VKGLVDKQFISMIQSSRNQSRYVGYEVEIWNSPNCLKNERTLMFVKMLLAMPLRNCANDCKLTAPTTSDECPMF